MRKFHLWSDASESGVCPEGYLPAPVSPRQPFHPEMEAPTQFPILLKRFIRPAARELFQFYPRFSLELVELPTVSTFTKPVALPRILQRIVAAAFFPAHLRPCFVKFWHECSYQVFSPQRSGNKMEEVYAGAAAKALFSLLSAAFFS